MINLFKSKAIKTKTASIILASLFFINYTNAQTVGTDAFIKATSVEIGVDGPGGFEGAGATPPVGMHARGGFGLFGFVANPQINLWATFDGDFFTPGSPENGWGLQVGATELSNNCNGDLDITGAITGYTHILDCYNTDWSGSVTSGTTIIGAKVNYFLQEHDLYYTTTVVLTNNSANTIPLLYYYRNVDPDNNQSAPGPGGGSFVTDNKIEDQAGGGSGCDLACVSASQSSGVTASYMAFAAVGSEYRVCYGGFSNRSGEELWNGITGVGVTPPIVQAVGSTHTDDEGISLAYRIQNFLPGTSRTVKFVTILKASDKNVALANLLLLSYPGSSFFPPSSCSAGVDTVKACGGGTKLAIVGPNVNAYTWTWSPGTFLSSTTTYSAICSPTATIVYTITGIPTTTVCVSPLPLSYTIAVKPYPALPVTISTNTAACIGSPIIFSAGGGSFYTWTGPNGFTSSTSTSSITPTSTLSSGEYFATITNSLGCSHDTSLVITVYPSPTLTVISPTTICSGQTATLTTGGADSYFWLPSASGSSIAVTPSVTTIYTVTGTNSPSNCFALTTTTVTVIPNATADYIGLMGGETFTVNNVLELINTSTNYDSFNWLLCDGTISTNSTVTLPLLNAEDCCIKLVASKLACKDSILKCFKVVPEFFISIPNVFSPNGDKMNDVFKFNSSGIKDMNCTIFNRWGNKVYEWNGTSGSWDGNSKSGPAPSGTYFYILNYTKYDDSVKTEKNFFTLFRD